MLIIFDVEGVLYDEEYLPLLAEKLHKEDEIWEITKQGIQGKINWEEGLRTRVAALKGLDKKTCQEVSDALPIMTGAKEACRVLKAAGWKIMAVSGGFGLMMDRLQKELGLDYVYSNDLIFKDGKLDGVTIHVDSDKSKSAKIKIAEWGEKKEDIEKTINMVLDLMPDEIGISVSYPLPGTKFYEIVKEQLEEKTNWTDSDELALMYKGTFSPSYYKKLHRYVHKVYRRKQSLLNLKNVLTNPFSSSKKKIRSAVSSLYYIPASIADSVILKKLET